jgi:hypothetical protein
MGHIKARLPVEVSSPLVYILKYPLSFINKYPNIPKNICNAINETVIIKKIGLLISVPKTVWNACWYLINAIPNNVKNGIIIQMLGEFSNAQPFLRADFIPKINLVINRIIAIEKIAIEKKPVNHQGHVNAEIKSKILNIILFVIFLILAMLF